MKASFGKKIAVLCLSAAMAIGVGFGLSGIDSVQAKAEFKDFEQIEQSYKLNSVVTVTNEEVAGVSFPKTIDVNGDETEIATAYVLTYPDGVSVSIKDTLTLNQLGKYEITYKAYVGNTVSVYYDTFVVHNNFANQTNTIELRERTTYSNYELDGTNYKKEKYGTVPTAEAKEFHVAKGVRVTLESGLAVTFNNIIDSNVVDEEGFATLATLNLTAVDRSTASLLNKYFDFTFTDVNDPNNFFTVTSSNQVGSIGHSFGVSTATTPLIGTADTYIDNAVEKEGSIRIFYVDGVRNAAYLNNTRTWANGEHEHYDYSIMYNPTTKVIKYKCVRWFNFENGKTETVSQDIIIDLDNPDIFDEGATLFKGFSTGEVKMTMSARDFSANNCYVDVYQLGTVTGEELQAYYNADTIVDNVKPTIKIDVKQTDVNGVYSAFDPESKDVKFYVPAAYAQDANDCTPVTYRVYKNYAGGDAAKVFVNLNDDGSFTLAENVVYTIEYKTSDIYGNEGVETLNVIPVIVEDLVAGDVQINEGIKAVFDKLNLVAGVTADASIVKYIDTLNLKSDLKLTVTVTKGGEVMFNGVYGYDELTATNKPTFDFKPLSAGTYVVNYDFADNANHIVYTYNATCVSDGVVEFAEAPLLQRFYNLGMTYEKPYYNAYNFGETVTDAETDCYVSYDNGNTWIKVEQTFVMGADAQGNYIAGAETVMFKYVSKLDEADEDDRIKYITAPAPIVDVRSDAAIANGDKLALTQKNPTGNLDQAKMFTTDNAVVYADSTKLRWKAASSTGNSHISFINPVSFTEVGNFYMQFDTDANKGDYNEFTVTLTDAYDPTNTVYWTMYMLGADTRLEINGGKAIASPIALKGNSIVFYYSVANQMVTIGTTNYTLEFQPTNNLFYIDLTMGDIYGDGAEITIGSLGNHAFRANRAYDSSAPMIYYASAAGSYPLNTVVTIAAPYVADVISPYVHTNADGSRNTKISVKLNGQYVKSVDGITLDGTQDPTRDYQLKLDQYATWKVEYIVTDSAGKMSMPNFNITAADMEAPVITLNYGFNENTIHNVTLGKTFSIESSVSDNVSKETKIQAGVIIIRDSDFFTIYSSKPHEALAEGEDLVPITDSCIITRKGLYTVYVLALDEAKNMTIVTYKLNVQ